MYFSGEKICLITGANSGIGKAAAKMLANLGASLILVCRNRRRAERTLEELSGITSSANLNLFIADLSSQCEILNLVKQIKNKFASLDILINNAGAYFSKYHITIDGIEASFSINYLSRFLLTNLLLELILKSKQGRIINVSGEILHSKKINFENIDHFKRYSSIKTFSRARLADIIFIYELSRRLKGTKATANCVHPGFTATNFIYNDPDSNLIRKSLFKVVKPFLRTPEKGAETVVYLASSPELANVSGKYFFDMQTTESSKLTYDENAAEELWRVSEKLIKVDLPSNYFMKNKFPNELEVG